ncbi:MAG: cell division protein FtsQ/DivIB [Pseudomonadota bacterium]
MRPVIRRDPAPSRIAYRLSRLWMRASVRRAVKVWMPSAIAMGALAAVALHPGNQARVTGLWMSAYAGILGHESFAITEARIIGADETTTSHIRDQLEGLLPASALTLDLDTLRAELEALSSVQTATLALDEGATLTIAVTEHVPTALWRQDDRLQVVGAGGAVIREAAMRSDHPDLPLLLGSGADGHVPEALSLFAAAQPLQPRVVALSRVGERRWTLHLAGGLDILLPEADPLAALRHGLALHASGELLDRDITQLDLRAPGRPIVRLSGRAVREVRRLRALPPNEDA